MVEKIPVSVVILAKNEERGIAECVRRVQAFDEVVVVDSGSADRTVERAEGAGARVVQFDWNGQYPKKKQWSLENTGLSHDWVLILDADESPSTELVAEIAAEVPSLVARRYGAYDICLTYRFAGKFLKHGHRVMKRSLLDRTVCSFPVVDDLEAPGIREVEGHYQPQTDRGVRRLKGRIEHDDRDPVSSWFERHNRYSDWEAYLRTHEDSKRSVESRRSRPGRVFARVPFKPIAFFVYTYLVRGGFLDGRAGFDYAIALSAYYWQIGLKVRELKRDDSQ